MVRIETPSIGGRSIESWDADWHVVPKGLIAHQAYLAGLFGLYRYRLGDRVMVLGAGTDTKGGIAKRCSDMIRPSPSGRDHYAGRMVFKHRDQLVLDVLITGDDRRAQKIARQLKWPMIDHHQPAWNRASIRRPSEFRPLVKVSALTSVSALRPFSLGRPQPFGPGHHASPL